VKFPEQVKWFFQACNGLRVIEPAISVMPLSDLKIGPNSTIEFAVIDNQHILSFDAARINEAGQWSIINSETGFVVTKTDFPYYGMDPEVLPPVMHSRDDAHWKPKLENEEKHDRDSHIEAQ
jgi:hypothetical protein